MIITSLYTPGVEDDHNITLHATVEQVLWGLDDPIIKVLYLLGLSPFPQFSLQVCSLLNVIGASI